MNNPLVSIIIPVYNVLPYLSEALNSVIHQTYRNLEIIIVDDGSEDDSGLLCDAYAAKDPRIRVIHQENQGISGARNTGLSCMTGELVSFLDSDDAFHPDMIRRMVDVMITEDVDVVTCGHTTHYTNENMPINTVEGRTACFFDRSSALRALIDDRISWYVWDKVYMRRCFETLRFPLGHVYEDVDTVYKVLAASNRVAAIDDPLVMYRKRAGSVTVEYSLDDAKDRDRAFFHVAEFVKKNTPEVFTEEQKQKMCWVRLDGVLGTYAKSGKEAWRYRDEVIQAAKDCDLRRCALRTRGKHFMFLYCPRFYTFIHRPYRTAKKHIVLFKAYLETATKGKTH